MNYNTDAGYRILKSGGNRFDSFFPVVEKRQTFLIKRNGDLEDSIDLIKDTARRYKFQTAKIAKVLKGDSLKNTCENIWTFCYSYIQYKLDETGTEQIRKPARVWHDRITGVDCDCFSVFISSILLNLNIPHYFKITDYGRGFQHIYIVVPKDGKSKSNCYIIDAVLGKFDFEKTPIINSRFIFMNIELLGAPESADDDKAILQKNIMAMKANPQLFEDSFDVPLFIQNGQKVLAVWDNVPARLQALEEIGGSLDGVEDDYFIDDEGLGSIKTLFQKAGAAIKKAIPKPNQRNPAKPKANVKTFFKNLGTKIKTVATKALDKNGDGKVNFKDVAHAVTRFNPVTVVMRNGFLLFLKIKGIKKKLNRLYTDPSKKQYVDKLEKWYYGLGGKPEKLREASNLNGLEGCINGLGELGEPVTATIIATATPLILGFLGLMKEAGIIGKTPESAEELQSWDANEGEAVDESTTTQWNESYKGEKENALPIEETNEPSGNSTGAGTGTGKFSFMENPALVLGAVLLLLFFIMKAGSGKSNGLNGLDGTRKRRKKRRKALGTIEDSNEDEDDGLGGTKKRKKKTPAKKTPAKKATAKKAPAKKATAKKTTAKKAPAKKESGNFKLM